MACGCKKKKKAEQPLSRSVSKLANIVNIRMVLEQLYQQGDDSIVMAMYNGNNKLAYSGGELRRRFSGVTHYGAVKHGQIIPILRADLDGKTFTEIEKESTIDELSPLETLGDTAIVYPLDELTDDKQKAYMLLINTELSYADIAEKTGLTSNQVQYIKAKYNLRN